MQIRLAENFRAIFYAPFYAAQALGFYAEQGIDVRFVPSASPGEGVAALLRGEIDLSWGGPMRVMKARETQNDSRLVCFCEVVSRDPFFVVGRRAQFMLKDLAEMRFAAVSEVPTPWLCLQHDLRRHGIDPSRVKRAPPRSMAENFQALCTGELDAVQVLEPYASMASAQGAGTVLYAASSRGPTVYTTFIAARERIEEKRSALAATVRAIADTQRWLLEHTAEELAERSAEFFPDIRPAILLGSLRRYREAEVWASTTPISREGFAQLAECLHSGGFLSRMPSYEDCVEQSLG